MVTQENKPEHNIYLKRVGFANLVYPITFKRNGKDVKHISKISYTIDVPKNKKGIHMSRLVDSLMKIMNSNREYETYEELGKDVIRNTEHQFTYAIITFVFPISIKRITPMSKRESIETYDVSIAVEKKKNRWYKKLVVNVTGNTLCPHALSMCGQTHMQRAIGTLEISAPFETKAVNLRDMIEVVEKGFSSSTYTLLKGEDEVYVIRSMHEKPKFVEDVTRDILYGAKEAFKGYKIHVKCLSMESIHKHDVVAEGYL